jgi:hypothetical protein
MKNQSKLFLIVLMLTNLSWIVFRPIDYYGKAEPAACTTLFPDTESGQKILFGHNGYGDAGSVRNLILKKIIDFLI